MKKLAIILIFSIILWLVYGCGATNSVPDIAATTLPVYDFTTTLCQGTGLNVGRLVTESISCLHDYTLQVSQMRMIEGAELVVISGAGLEDFLSDAMEDIDHIVDASSGAHVHEGDHAHNNHEEHHHEIDPHIWLSPENAQIMATNICRGLSAHYPEHADIFNSNLKLLVTQLEELQEYGEDTLRSISCRELITFHNGFAYFAESFDLTILEAVEEESGSEASAAELIHLIHLVDSHALPSVFTEINGSVSAADVIFAETGAAVYPLDMAMSGNSYFAAMYHNIDTIKEALG